MRRNGLGAPGRSNLRHVDPQLDAFLLLQLCAVHIGHRATADVLEGHRVPESREVRDLAVPRTPAQNDVRIVGHAETLGPTLPTLCGAADGVAMPQGETVSAAIARNQSA